VKQTVVLLQSSGHLRSRKNNLPDSAKGLPASGSFTGIMLEQSCPQDHLFDGGHCGVLPVHSVSCVV